MPGGVFCIENWSGHLASKLTVQPLLEFLEASDGTRTIHQRVSTERELAHYLRWFSALSSYPVGYLALHGERGHVSVGAQSVEIETLLDWTNPKTGAPVIDPGSGESVWTLDLKGKVLYLGSCASLNIGESRLEALRKESGAIAICGYRRSVDWYEAAAFDILLLSELAQATEGERQSVQRAIKRVRKRAAGLTESLGFICEPDWRP